MMAGENKWAFYCFIALAGLLPIGCGQGGEDTSVEDFPDRPVTIICPWAAGGGTDTASRITAEGLHQVLGTRVNVVNQTGGAGVAGHSAGAKAKPDGYTLTMITAELNMMHWRGLTDIGPRDFEPIMIMNKICASIFVREDSPWKTMTDLRQAIKDNPGKLTASGTAKGGIWHLACAAWLIAGGLEPDDLIWVPSKGAAPALQQLISEGIDVVFCAPAEGKSLIDSGKARLLAVFSDVRSPVFPDVPTCIEQGVDVEIYGWAGIAAPVGTPLEIRSKLESALQRVAASEDFRTRMNNSGFLVATENSERFREILARDDIRFGKLLKDAGITQ
ncbi:MAG: tripartite tricarboxylate transporter substrate binding protein [bacterium]